MKFSEKEIDDFIGESSYKSYANIVISLLKTGEKALIKQSGWDESEYLQWNIRSCVKSYSRDKDQAILMFKDFISFLKRRGISMEREVEFPPIPVMNSFERLMFIAKFMQDENNSRNDLIDILWQSKTTIDNDFSRLLNEDNPEAIQVLGKPFIISGAKAHGGKVDFESTAHPIFLTPNLTQVIYMLEGLKYKAQNPIYETEAVKTAADIWNQLSDYAKDRIRTVLSGSLITDDLTWYESLERPEDTNKNSFHIEKKSVKDWGFIVDCVKNDNKPFCIEYKDGNRTTIFENCTGKKIIEGKDITVKTDSGIYTLHIKNIVSIGFTIEELLSEESCVVHK